MDDPCWRGLHDLSDPANVYLPPDGRRQCLPCKRERDRAYRRGGPTGTCRRGLHDMSDPANVYVAPGGDRQCLPCRRERNRRRYLARKEARGG